MTKHLPFIKDVYQGRTVFRGMSHCITTLASGKLEPHLKLRPEE
jgi:hypothetical protein